MAQFKPLSLAQIETLCFCLNHKSGTIQTDITGTNKPISLAQFDPIYPFGSLPVFEDADTYPAIFIYSNNRKESFHYKSIKKKDDLNYTSIKSVTKTEISIDSLSNEAWNFDGFNLKEHLREKHIEYKTLEKIGKAYIGDLTGMDKAFVITNEDAKSLNLEKELLYPYAYRGNEIDKYINVKPLSSVIYPYKRGDDGKPILIIEDKLKLRFPLIYNYLLNYKEDLEKRKDSRKLYANGKNWYRHLRAGNFSYIEPKKIIFKGIENVFKAGYLEEETVFNGANCPAIIIEDTSYSIFIILTILNSKISTYYLTSIRKSAF